MSSESAPSALSPALQEAMTRRGFLTLTPVQEKVLDPELAGRDLRIASQTGSGKTLAVGFVLAPDAAEPVVVAPRDHAAHPRAIVVAPTRELAAQLGRELSWLYEPQGSKVCVVAGGSNVRDELRALGARPAVIVGTPGRLLDHLTRAAIVATDVKSVVLDEADQMLDLGFREELEAILEKLPVERRTHLVSATFSREVLTLASRYQSEAVLVEGTSLGRANVDIQYSAHLVRAPERADALVNVLLLTPEERCLVFVRTRAETSDLAEKLGATGFRALPISGELEQRERNKTLEAFKTGMINILVATDVAARGLDIEDVVTVVHYDLPTNTEDLTHRSGRTGRAGKKGQSVLLVPPQAKERTERLLARAKIDARWRAVPTEEDVLSAAESRLKNELDQATSQDLEPRALAFAERLLAEYDAAALVSSLLGRLEYRGPTAPRAVKVLELERRRPHRDAPGQRPPPREPFGHRHAPRDAGRDAPQPRDAARGAPRPRDVPPARRTSNGVAFRISFGAQDGADPRRLMAIVCRWGKVKGDRIGAIRIDETDSTFEIAPDAAEDFSRAVSRPDPRNPKLRIQELRQRQERGGHAPPRRRAAER